MSEFRLLPGHLNLNEIFRFYMEAPQVTVADAAWDAVRDSQQTVESILVDGRTIYGINTGFGLLAQKRIPADDLESLQSNLVLSHAAGTGPLLDRRVVRLVMLLKIASLMRGHSGVRPVVVETLLQMLNFDVIPCVPSQGSVGASGDLAPLAHLSCSLIGVGDVEFRGEKMPAVKALNAVGLQPLVLGPKEGLALLNGTQVSTALALAGLHGTMNVFGAAMVVRRHER